MCDCKKDIEAKLLERFVEQTPAAEGHKVKLQGYGLIFGAAASERAYMPIEATASHLLKKGGMKSKTTKQNMFFNFCPFCGVVAL